MAKFPGVGERMKERLRAIGYVKPNGDLRVSDFCLDHRYQGTMMYDWLADRRTPIRDLERLARDLNTTPAFLLFGVDVVTRPPKAMPPRRRTRRASGPFDRRVA